MAPQVQFLLNQRFVLQLYVTLDKSTSKIVKCKILLFYGSRTNQIIFWAHLKWTNVNQSTKLWNVLINEYNKNNTTVNTDLKTLNVKTEKTSG